MKGEEPATTGTEPGGEKRTSLLLWLYALIPLGLLAVLYCLRRTYTKS